WGFGDGLRSRQCLPVRLSGSGCSSQFGRTSAPTVPHLVHTMRGPNDGTVRSPGRWATLTITRWRQLLHWTSSDRTPLPATPTPDHQPKCEDGGPRRASLCCADHTHSENSHRVVESFGGTCTALERAAEKPMKG